MVTDKQVRRLQSLINAGCTQEISALKADMDVKTARKYLKVQKLPSDMRVKHDWRTKKDSFSDDWDWVKNQLELNGRLEIKTIFDSLQRENPGKYTDNQLRTLQRKVKIWKIQGGCQKEVFFDQIHKPGELSQSDFTHMGSIGVTIKSQSFEHLLYHFVLTYSNWESVSICYSESYESLSEGLQNALWELGGSPRHHRTDSLSAAVNNLSEKEEFTERYKSLLSYYRLNPQRINVRKANENGDVEQSHHRFKRALEQNLILRGSNDFESIDEYDAFLKKLVKQKNSSRVEKFTIELGNLSQLPLSRLKDCRSLEVRVTKSSTVRVLHNNYSVPSSLIGEWVKVNVYAREVEIWYSQKLMDKMPRMKGEGKSRINYRHIIDSLVRKPGAFENYRYKEELFPTSRFRMAYDLIIKDRPSTGVKEYLQILHLSARENETLVDDALRYLFDTEKELTYEAIEQIVLSGTKIKPVTDVTIDSINLNEYDKLLEASYGY